MSSFTADSFGIPEEDNRIGCVAKTANNMKNCILDFYPFEGNWGRLRKNKLEFVQNIENPDYTIKVLNDIIEENLQKIRNTRLEGSTHKMEHSLVTTSINEAREPCPEGKKHYGIRYPDAKEAIILGRFESHFAHYQQNDNSIGKRYLCSEYKRHIEDPTESQTDHKMLSNTDKKLPKVSSGLSIESKIDDSTINTSTSEASSTEITEACTQGEQAYAQDYPGVKKAVDAGIFESHFAHYKILGRKEGKKYSCLLENKSLHIWGLPRDQNANELANWKANVCDSIKDNICWEVRIVPRKKVAFCSAAKVASTTTKQYFFNIAKGDVVIPDGAKFGVHEANWKRFGNLDGAARRFVLKSPLWTHVFFWRHVLERFVSGYLDKVVHDCENNKSIKPHLAISYYIQFGFSCEEHKDLESFVNFMETVPKFEGHFHAQTPLCSLERYPYTDFIQVDEKLNVKLEALSSKLGVEHPELQKKSRRHQTGSKSKMVDVFQGKPYLVSRILGMFKEDCAKIPEACDVKDLMDAIKVRK